MWAQEPAPAPRAKPLSPGPTCDCCTKDSSPWQSCTAALCSRGQVLADSGDRG